MIISKRPPKNPFRKMLHRLTWLTFWVLLLGGISFGFYELVDLHGHAVAKERKHTWGHTRDTDARVIASDALVSMLGQKKATKARLVAIRKVTIAGGRDEWVLRYRVLDGFDAPVCIYVWKAQDEDYGDWIPKTDIVSVCE